MAQSRVKTPFQYLSELPPERREVLQSVRKVILDNLPKGYVEGMQYGMIGYYVPLLRYPAGYLNDPKQPLLYIALAAQKNYYALHFMGIYGNEEIESWFLKAYEASGKKLDMGKSCLRFKKLDDLALGIIGEAVAKISVEDFITRYETSRTKK